MQYRITAADPATLRTACLVLPVFSRRKLSAAGEAVDKASGGHLGRLLRKGALDGELGQSLLLHEVAGISAASVLLVGCGAHKDFGRNQLRQTGTLVARTLNDGPAADASLLLDGFATTNDETYATSRDLIQAMEDALYRFDQCKSEVKPPKKPLRKLTLVVNGRARIKAAEKAATHAGAIAAGMQLTKDLANLPGNLCTPSHLADEARKLGRKSSKLKVSVLTEKQMQRLGMGALLSVSRGSREEAKLIVMEYQGGKADQKPVALVGKGLTFDAGGISIKPAANMDEMKYDMCGGASVIGTIAACIEMELPLNVVGVVPSSENLPDGDANKPGDIVTSMSGQTIEILNTDAEGRLILCDALTYTERFEPAAVVDIATLTGACIIALGDQASGLMANDDKLADELLAAGSDSGDRAWRLPLWDEYQKQLDSNFADMANIGGRGAGTVTAACFLSRFTKKFKWAHLDIAGTAWKSGAEKGATARPVPLLMQFLLKRARQV